MNDEAPLPLSKYLLCDMPLFFLKMGHGTMVHCFEDGYSCSRVIEGRC